MCLNGAETHLDYRDVSGGAEGPNPGVQHAYNVIINDIMLS